MDAEPAITAYVSPLSAETIAKMKKFLSVDVTPSNMTAVEVTGSCIENPHITLTGNPSLDNVRSHLSPEAHPASKFRQFESTGRLPSPLPRLRSNARTGAGNKPVPNIWANGTSRNDDGDSRSTKGVPQSQSQQQSQSRPGASLSKSQLWPAMVSQKADQNIRDSNLSIIATAPLSSTSDEGENFTFAVPDSLLPAKVKVPASSMECLGRDVCSSNTNSSSNSSSRSISFSDSQSRYPTASNSFRKSVLPSHPSNPTQSDAPKNNFDSLRSVLPSNIQYLAHCIDDLNMKKSLSFEVIEDSPTSKDENGSKNRQRSTTRMSIDSTNISALMTPNMHTGNSRGATSDSLLILELETVHVLNERLTLSLETLQGRHEEEKDTLLQQLSSVCSECEELSVENTALAAVLLGGARESLEKFCASSSSPDRTERSGGENREVIRELNNEFTLNSARKGERKDVSTGSARGHPSRATKVSAATLALIELQELFEQAVGNSKPQHELEVKFAADMRTAKRELADSQTCLLAAKQAVKQLEAERLTSTQKAEGETQSVGAMLEERDSLLRKAAKEVAAVRSDCVEVGRKYEAVKADLNEARVKIALLKQEVLGLHEDTIGDLEKQTAQLRSQLKESVAHSSELQKSAANKSLGAAQSEKDLLLARAESYRALGDLKLMEEDLAAKTVLIAELRAREAAAGLRKKVFEEQIVALRLTAASEKDDFSSLIKQSERLAEEQKGDMTAFMQVEVEKRFAEVDKLLSQISDLKGSEELFRLEREEWEAGRLEGEKRRQLAFTAEKAAAERARGILEQKEEALRSLEEEKALLSVSLALKDSRAANERETYLEDIRVRDAASAEQLVSERASLVERERSLSAETALKRESAFRSEKDSLLATIAEFQDTLSRERAAHCDLLGAKEKAAAADRAALCEVHGESKESFRSQRDALNGHISALKETGSGERAALLSLLSSLREAADKEKDMMELLQVAENSHKKEHDAMLHRLSLSEGEAAQARSSVESSSRDCDKAGKDREQLAKELRDLKGEEENLVNLLSDVKDAFKVEKEGLSAEIGRLAGEMEEVRGENDSLQKRISALDKQLSACREEQHSIVKEKAVLLTRVIFLGEQRSDLLLQVEDMGKRTAEQTATIAGLNEEWGSMQAEMSCAEKEKGTLEAALQSAVAARERAESLSAEQISALQSDLNGYIGDSDALQADHDRAMGSLRSEMKEVELQYTHQEEGFLRDIQGLRGERDQLAATLRAERKTHSGTDRDLSSEPPSANRNRYIEKNYAHNMPEPPPSAAPASSGTVRRKVSLSLLAGDYDEAEDNRLPHTQRQGDSDGTYVDSPYSEAIYFGASSDGKVSDMEATMREIEMRQRAFREQQRGQAPRM